MQNPGLKIMAGWIYSGFMNDTPQGGSEETSHDLSSIIIYLF
jgi:hypothetical protein